MREYFDRLVDLICGETAGEEVVLINFSGEDSDFVRLSGCKVRQAGNVVQQYVEVDLVAGRRAGRCR